jgi:hypothetical protein
MSVELWKHVPRKFKRKFKSSHPELVTASGQPLELLGTCSLPVRMGDTNYTVSHEFVITKGTRKPVILGYDCYISKRLLHAELG